MDLPGRLTVPGHGVLKARVLDLSDGGARIRGEVKLADGARGTLSLDGVGAALAFTVRHADGDVLDVAFELDQKATAALQPMLARLAAARLAA